MKWIDFKILCIYLHSRLLLCLFYVSMLVVRRPDYWMTHFVHLCVGLTIDCKLLHLTHSILIAEKSWTFSIFVFFYVKCSTIWTSTLCMFLSNDKCHCRIKCMTILSMSILKLFYGWISDKIFFKFSIFFDF